MSFVKWKFKRRFMFAVALFVFTSPLANCLFLPAHADSKQGTKWGYFPRSGLSVSSDMTVSGIDPGSAAEKVALRIGDQITSIEGHEVSRLSRPECFKLLSGEAGTVCHLLVWRAGRQYSVAVTRSQPAHIAKDQADNSAASSSSTTSGQEKNLDRYLITIDGHTNNTDAIYEKVLIALKLLPAPLKQALLSSGISMVITASRQKFDDGPEGKCCFEPRFKRVVIVENGASTPLGLKRMPITVLHEIGHAYDFMRGYISKRPDFLSNYQEDSQGVTGELTTRLSYFLQAGHRGPSECFASLFARKYFAGPDRRLEDLEGAFPRSFKLVQSLRP